MSRTIDARVVEMTFDNSQFEAGVKTSMNTLEKLKSKLQLEDAHDGLTKVTKTIKEVTFNNLSNSVSDVISKLSTLDHVIWNLKDKLANMTISFATSLTVDPVKQGWQKYESKLQAVATIQAATGETEEAILSKLEQILWFTDETSYSFSDMVSAISKLTSSGMSLDDSITAAMGVANWAAISGVNATNASSIYYNIAQAIGKGTLLSEDWRSIQMQNMGTPEFKQLVIEIAKLNGTLDKNGRIVGSKNNEVVTADNFDSMLQYKWVTKEVLMDTLSYYGKFTSVLYDYINYLETTEGRTISTTQAIKELANILLGGSSAAGDYAASEERAAESADALADAQQNAASTSGATATTQQEAADAAAALAESEQTATEQANSLAKSQLNLGNALTLAGDAYSLYNSESTEAASTATKKFTGDLLTALYGADKAAELQSKYNTDSLIDAGFNWITFGEETFRAGQESRTLTDSIEAVKDGISTGWSETAEIGYGDPSEAKELSAMVYDLLSKWFDHSQERNELLTAWKEAGGRANLIEGLVLSFDALDKIITSVAHGIRRVFKPMTSEKLVNITARFKELAQTFNDWLLSSNKYDHNHPISKQITEITEGLAKAVQVVLKIKRAFFAGVRQIIGGDTVEKLLAFGAEFSQKFVKFADDLENGNFYSNITKFVGGFGPLFQSATTAVWNFATQFWHDVSAPFQKKEDGTFETTWFSPIANALMSAWEQGKILVEKIKNLDLSIVGTWFTGLWDIIKGIFKTEETVEGEVTFSEKIVNFFASIIDWFSGVLTKINNLDYEAVGKWFNDLWAKVGNIVDQIKNSQFVKDVSAWFSTAFASIGDWFTKLWEKVKSFNFQSIIDWFNNFWDEFTKPFKQNGEQDATEQTETWVTKVGAFFKKLWDILDDLLQKLLAFDFEGIGVKIGEIWNSIITWISGIFSPNGTKSDGTAKTNNGGGFNLSKILGKLTMYLGLAAGVVLIWKIINIVGDIAKALRFGAQKLASANADTFSDKVGAIADVIINIGKSVALIAASIWVVGNMNFWQALQGVGMIVLVLGAIVGALYAIKQLGLSDSGFGDIGKSMLSLAGAIALMVVPIYLLGSMNEYTFWSGYGRVWLIGVFFTAVATVFKLINAILPSNILQTALAMLAIAGALNLMIVPLIAFSFIPVSSFWKAGGVILGLAGAVILIAKAMKIIGGQQGALWSGIGAVAVLTLVLWGLSAVLPAFNTIETTSITKAFYAVLALEALAAIMAVIGMIGLGPLASGAAGIVLVAAAVGAAIAILGRAVSGTAETASSSLWQCASLLGSADVLLAGVDYEKIEGMGGCLYNFYTKVKDINPSDIKASDIAAKISEVSEGLLAFANDITTNDPLSATQTANSTLDEIDTMFGKIKTLINGLGDSGIDTSTFTTTLGQIGGAYKLFGSNLQIGISSLTGIAGETGSIVDENGQITEGAVSLAVQGFHKTVQALADNMPNSELISTIASYAEGGANDLTGFATGIENIATALSDYGTSIEGIDPEKVKVANGILQQLDDLDDAARLKTTIGGILNIWTHGTINPNLAMTKFKNNITGLGTALGSYITAIGGMAEDGLNKDNIDLAMTVLERLVDLDVKLRNSTVLKNAFGFTDTGTVLTTLVFEWLDGFKDLGDISTAMVNLGDGFRFFIGGLNGVTYQKNEDGTITEINNASQALTKLNTDDIDLALSIIEKLADIELKLRSENLGEVIGDIWGFIGGKNLKDTFSPEIMGSIGTGIASFLAAVGPEFAKLDQNGNKLITPETIQNIFDVIGRFTEAQNNLGTSANSIWGVLSGKESLGNFGSNIGDLGTGISTFMTNVKDVNPTEFNSFIDALAKLAGFKIEDLSAYGTSTTALTTILTDVSGAYGALAGNIQTFIDNANKLKEISPENFSALASLITACTNAQVMLAEIDTSTKPITLYDLGTALYQFAGAYESMVMFLGEETNPFQNLYHFGAAVNNLTQAAVAAQGLDESDYTNLVEFMRVFAGQDFTTLEDASGGLIADGFFASFSEGFQNGTNSTITLVELLCDKIATTAKNKLDTHYDSFITSGTNFGIGLANGIRSGTSEEEVGTAAWNLGKLALTKLNAALDEESPSHETMQTGEYFDEGLAIGIDNASGTVEKSSSNLGKAATAVLAKTMNSTFDSGLEQFGKDGGTSIATEFVGAFSNVISNAKIDGLLGDALTKVYEEVVPDDVKEVVDPIVGGLTKDTTSVSNAVKTVTNVAKAANTANQKNKILMAKALVTMDKANDNYLNYDKYNDMDADLLKYIHLLDMHGTNYADELLEGLDPVDSAYEKVVDSITGAGKSVDDALGDSGKDKKKSSTTRNHTKVISSVDVSKAQSIFTAINAIGDKVTMLGDAVSSMQIVMDSGVMVGQIEHKVDQRLGQIAALKGRGL